MTNYNSIIDILPKQDLLEIYVNLNNWQWDNRLGDLPEGWDAMPLYIMSNMHKIINKNDLLAPIMDYISTKTTEKERVKYYHVVHLEKSRLEHELWWIIDKICQFLKLGWYSKEGARQLYEIFQQQKEECNKQWVKQQYYPNKD